MRKKITSVEIYNDERYLIPVMSFIDSVVQNHNTMDQGRYQQFRFIVCEIIRTRIRNSYPGSRGSLFVEMFLEDDFVEVSVRDKGVPGWQDFSYDISKSLTDSQNMRNFILGTFSDGVGLEKLGFEGQRVYVRKKIIDPLTFKAPEPYPEVEVLDNNISIRKVENEADAIEAIRCIYSEYGYSYCYERLYYVSSFMQMINNGDIMSFIAVNDHGQTAGHFALAFSDLYKGMPEISTVVIRKEFRGLGLFGLFMKHAEDVARDKGLRALMGQPVTFHPMSQKAFLKAGYTATSLLMSYLDASLESEYNQNTERLGLAASVRMIDESASSTIYPPSELRGFLDKIYSRMGWKYSLNPCNGAAEETHLSVENNLQLHMTRIVLRQSGRDVETLIKEAVNETVRNKNDMVELLILLSDPGCEQGYIGARNCGFALSGVIPGGEGGDYLIMQMLPADNMDYDSLVLVGEFEELRDDIKMLNNV